MYDFARKPTLSHLLNIQHARDHNDIRRVHTHIERGDDHRGKKKIALIIIIIMLV